MDNTSSILETFIDSNRQGPALEELASQLERRVRRSRTLRAVAMAAACALLVVSAIQLSRSDHHPSLKTTTATSGITSTAQSTAQISAINQNAASKIVDRAVLPPGSQPIPTIPSLIVPQTYATFRYIPGCWPLAVATRFWVVSGTIDSARKFFADHPIQGMRLTGQGAEGERGPVISLDEAPIGQRQIVTTSWAGIIMIPLSESSVGVRVDGIYVPASATCGPNAAIPILKSTTSG